MGAVGVLSGGGGLHTRAGNAMGRTRDGLLDGAVASIQRDGLRHLTMSGICTRSGVAKATLYNHFRTKADVLSAVVGREVDRVADVAQSATAAGSLADGLNAAADYVATFAPGRAVAAGEPQALVPLLTAGTGRGWEHARGRASAVLDVDPGDPLVDLVLAWLGSVLMAAPTPTSRRANAELLAAAAAARTRADLAGPCDADAGGDSGGPVAEPAAVTAGTTGTST